MAAASPWRCAPRGGTTHTSWMARPSSTQPKCHSPGRPPRAVRQEAGDVEVPGADQPAVEVHVAGAIGRGAVGPRQSRKADVVMPPLPRSCPFQRLLHGAHPVLHHAADGAGEIVRQQIGDPDDAAAPALLGEHLQRPVVMRRPALHHGPDQAAGRIVDVDDELARHQAVGEGDDACAAPSSSRQSTTKPGARRDARRRRRASPPRRSRAAPRSPFPCEWKPSPISPACSSGWMRMPAAGAGRASAATATVHTASTLLPSGSSRNAA